MNISKQTAMDIALAYREVETAEKLLADVRETMSRHTGSDIRDAFGRVQHGLQLGVPSGENGHRLFNVPFALAAPIIEAHIATQTAIISALTEKAKIEMAALTSGGAQ
jgi:hypothetical protein